MKNPSGLFCLIFMYVVLNLSGASFANAASKYGPTSAIGHEVEAAIKNVLACKNGGIPSESALRTLFEYMSVNDGSSFRSQPAKRNAEGMGIFWRFTFNKPFTQTLRYLYNPNIAPEILYPSSIRRGGWLPGSDIITLAPPLWKRAENVEGQLAIRGKEFEEITPDTFSGSYYSYTLDRLLLLQKCRDVPVLFSVGWQDGESSEGKKGWFLGDYADWDFVFTDASGGTDSSIGWMSTYMYASCTITLFFPVGVNGENTGCAMFKWLKAGWSGINAVNRSHISSGASRSFEGLLGVIEDSHISGPETLEAITASVRALDRAQLLERTAAYSLELSRASRDEEILGRSEFQKMLEGGKYNERISEAQLRSMLAVNELKKVMGKKVLSE